MHKQSMIVRLGELKGHLLNRTHLQPGKWYTGTWSVGADGWGAGHNIIYCIDNERILAFAYDPENDCVYRGNDSDTLGSVHCITEQGPDLTYQEILQIAFGQKE